MPNIYSLGQNTKTPLKVRIIRHNSAVKRNDVHYAFLKQFQKESLKLLLEIYYDIWTKAGYLHNVDKQLSHRFLNREKTIQALEMIVRFLSYALYVKPWQKMVNNRLVWYLESRKLMIGLQYGFSKKNITVDHMVCLESCIRGAFLNKVCIATVFFDLEKSWKYGIMRDPYDLGMKGRLSEIIKNFLSGRCSRVCIGSILSDPKNQE